MSFLDVFQQVAVLFVLFVVGYAVRKKGMFGAELTGGLSRFLMNVSLPALILTSMQREFSSALLGDSIVILGISVAAYAVYIGAALLLGRFSSSENAGVYQFCLVFTNVGFLGFPILDALLGGEAIFFGAIFNIPFHFLAYTVGAVFITRGHKAAVKLTPALFITPPVGATLLGFLFFVTSMKFPFLVSRPLELLGSLTTPLSLVLVGSMLAENPLRDILDRLSDYGVALVRLVLFPLALFFVLRIFFPPGMLLYVPVIIGAMPVAAAASILAGAYESRQQEASKMVFLTTLFSIVTIPFIIALLFGG